MRADPPLVFVDTNVLVYAYDRSAGQKREKARHLLDQLRSSNTGCLSVQVLQEFYVAVTQKVQRPMDQKSAAEIVRDLAFWRVHTPFGEDVLGAFDMQRRHNISFWDTMILWSAGQLDCPTIWSEGLTADHTYDGVLVRNPFVP